MYNITIPENTSSNCFDSIFCSLLEYYNFDYEVYNLKYFYTDYYNHKYGYICRGNYSINVLKDICHIDLIYSERNESETLFDTISNSLKNCPVGIVIDPYYCYWSPFYHKSHYSHMLLIVDIEYNEKKYVCFDVYFNTTGYVKVDFDIIHNNFERYFAIEFNEVKEINLEHIIQNINTLINNFDDNVDRKKSEMISYFTTTRRETLFSEDIKTSVPLINIMWITEDKKHSKILFKYIEDRNKIFDFSLIYELLTMSEQKFTFLKLILIKYAMSGILQEESIKNTINQIFDTDVLIVHELKNILGDKI